MADPLPGTWEHAQWKKAQEEEEEEEEVLSPEDRALLDEEAQEQKERAAERAPITFSGAFDIDMEGIEAQTTQANAHRYWSMATETLSKELGILGTPFDDVQVGLAQDPGTAWPMFLRKAIEQAGGQGRRTFYSVQRVETGRGQRYRVSPEHRAAVAVLHASLGQGKLDDTDEAYEAALPKLLGILEDREKARQEERFSREAPISFGGTPVEGLTSAISSISEYPDALIKGMDQRLTQLARGAFDEKKMTKGLENLADDLWRYGKDQPTMWKIASNNNPELVRDALKHLQNVTAAQETTEKIYEGSGVNPGFNYLPLTEKAGRAVDLRAIRVLANMRALVDWYEEGPDRNFREFDPTLFENPSQAYVDEIKRELLNRKVPFADGSPEGTLEAFRKREGGWGLVPDPESAFWQTQRVSGSPYLVAKTLSAFAGQALPKIWTTGYVNIGDEKLAMREEELFEGLFGRRGVTSAADYFLALSGLEAFSVSWALATREVAQKHEGNIEGYAHEILPLAVEKFGTDEHILYAAHHSDALPKMMGTFGQAVAYDTALAAEIGLVMDEMKEGIHGKSLQRIAEAEPEWYQRTRKEALRQKRSLDAVNGALDVLGMAFIDIDAATIAVVGVAKTPGLIRRGATFFDMDKSGALVRATKYLKADGKVGGDAVESLVERTERCNRAKS